MKIEINKLPEENLWKAEVWDGPDGIDYAEFLCGSLGECFEQVNTFRVMNGLTYAEDVKEGIKAYFVNLN